MSTAHNVVVMVMSARLKRANASAAIDGMQARAVGATQPVVGGGGRPTHASLGLRSSESYGKPTVCEGDE